MDGIEAIAAIRALDGDYFKNIPIIALTANAITGMKEMFLEKSFNDYLSKPIEIARLDGIVSKWIPKEKKIAGDIECGGKEAAPFVIPGIDTDRGIQMTGGSVEGYKLVLSQFCRDAEKRFHFFDYAKGDASDCNASVIAINAHAIKSAAATIWAETLSKAAAELEAAGKASDINAIKEKLPDFYKHLKETAERIRVVLEEKTDTAGNSGTPGLGPPDPAVRILFLELKTALEVKDIEAIDRAAEELAHKKLDKETTGILNAVSDLLLVSKFKAALDTVNALLEDYDIPQ
jgi:CheY-like chemotaxis protein